MDAQTIRSLAGAAADRIAEEPEGHGLVSRIQTHVENTLLVLDDQQEEFVIEQALSHWFTQGGAVQFGPLDLPSKNADGLISAILSAVRKKVK